MYRARQHSFQAEQVLYIVYHFDNKMRTCTSDVLHLGVLAEAMLLNVTAFNSKALRYIEWTTKIWHGE